MFLIAMSFVKNLTWKGWLAVGAVAIILALLTTLAVNKVIDRWGDNKQITENNEDRALREDLSVKRTETNAQIITEERKLNEILDKLPDAVPSDRRLARACNELRSDSRHVVLPAACGPREN